MAVGTNQAADENSFTTEEYYETHKYFDNNEYDVYYMKSVKYNSDPWYYRIKSIDGKTAYVVYHTIKEFQDDTPKDYNIYSVVIEGKKMTLTNSSNKKVRVYQNFDTMAATKDKKESL